MVLYQVVYISAATVPFSDDDLAALLANARANNEKAGISGMLLYHDGSFIQVLEGEQAAVEAVYSRIEGDSRHSSATILLRGEVEERTFDAWSMGFLPTKSLRDIPEGFHPFLKKNVSVTEGSESAARNALRDFKAGRWGARL